MKIEWKPVVGYSDLYLVSTQGEVKGIKSKKILKQSPDENNHLQVGLCKKGKSTTTHVHVIVAQAFHGFQPPDKPYACHNDGNPQNNTPSNVYWGTPTQNSADAKRHGRANAGERNRGAKLTELQVREILKLRLEGYTSAAIHRSGKYPVSPERIQEITSGRSWKHVFKKMNPNSSPILKKVPTIIPGGLFVDDRGSISFFNDMNFFGVKRMYSIQHFDTGMIRAWHYHDYEGKFVYASSGTFLVGAVNPKNEKVRSFVLSSKQPRILWIPPKHANGFKNLEKDSILVFFSTSTVDESKNDDVRYPYDKWDIWTPNYR